MYNFEFDDSIFLKNLQFFCKTFFVKFTKLKESKNDLIIFL
jgi:hypothetical protein